MEIFRRHKDFGDTISKETHAKLRERLSVTDEAIRIMKRSIGESFKKKVYGMRTDAEHNVYTESLSFTISTLEDERMQILQRLDTVGSGLAKRALDEK